MCNVMVGKGVRPPVPTWVLDPFVCPISLVVQLQLRPHEHQTRVLALLIARGQQLLFQQLGGPGRTSHSRRGEPSCTQQAESAEQKRAEQKRAEQERAEQERAEEERAEKRRAEERAGLERGGA